LGFIVQQACCHPDVGSTLVLGVGDPPFSEYKKHEPEIIETDDLLWLAALH
jgi:hypothetical protein